MSGAGGDLFGARAGDSDAISPDLARPSPLEDDRPRHWVLRIVAVVIAVLVIAAAVASRWTVPYYAITPGHAFDVGTLITVPSGQAHEHDGAVIETDVELSQLSALGYAYYYVRQRDEIISSAELTGGESSNQYVEEGVIDMATARQAAALVALRELGYRPRAVPDGVAVYAIVPGAPASTTPAVGNVITAANSQPTVSFDALKSAVGVVAPGRTISLTFHMLGAATSHTARYRTWAFRDVRLGKATETVCVAPTGHQPGTAVLSRGHPQSCLPFDADPIYRDIGEPFPVSISTGGIVGPSAGLSFTLGLIEKLDHDDLTGGHRVAATGTMSNDGAVGAVGGVAEKTIAVRAAGASVFLVPDVAVDLQPARANAGPSLKVIAVSSIGQALAALERLGGRLSLPNLTAEP